MSYVTLVWALVGACGFVLAVMYGFVWVLDRQARASLAFAGVALSVSWMVIVELGMMQATTPESWGEWIRWSQLPIFLRVAATLAFIRFYFGTQSDWLMWTIIALRFYVLVAGFFLDPNFNFQRIDSIDHMTFLGEEVTVVGKAVPRGSQWIATTATLLTLVYVAHATIAQWRLGTRDAHRNALIVGGATFISCVMATLYSQLIILFGVKIPVLISPPFLLMLGAMTFEMSRSTLAASRLARELRESEARLEFAASAAGIGLWLWDVDRKQIWATNAARELFELSGEERLDVDHLRRMVFPEDVSAMSKALEEATSAGDEHELHFRIRRRDGSTRWILVRGRAESDVRGRISLIRGVLRDVTEQWRTRQENEELRRDLAHASRVSVLGSLSSSLAHELGQPLAAIMLNTEAAELMLRRPNPDLDELRHIIADIHRDDRRAAEVIEHLRSLLKRGQMESVPISAQALLQEIAAMLKSDAIARHVSLDCENAGEDLMISGDKVHLSQVLINLIINAMDAVSDLEPGRRKVTLRVSAANPGWVEFAVSDNGTGIPADAIEKIFEPFYTTKPAGMGFGLSVSRTIVEAHGGKIWAQNDPGGGATLRFKLPVSEPGA